MANTIQIKRSSTSGSAPTTSQLAQGELAVNLADGALYTENATPAIIKLNAPSIDDKNTGATKHVTIDTSGNVGIGTSSPNLYGVNKAITLNAAAGQSCVYEYAVGGTHYGYFGGSASATWMGSKANIPTILYTNDTERARIDSSGNLLVGTTSAAGEGLTIYPAGGAGSTPQLLWNRPSSTTSGAAALFRNGGTNVGSITYTNTATSYVTSSDYRLKHDIQPMTGALAKVAQLKPVTYKWNADDSQSQGFIAHELQEVVPECVTGEKDALDAEGNPQYQGIDTSFLVATLTAAIQEQQALIASQSEIISAQQTALTALTARVEALEGAQA